MAEYPNRALEGFLVVMRIAAVLGAAVWCAAAPGQTHVVLPPLSTPMAAQGGSAVCGAGFAEVVATHFRVSGEADAPMLHRGTLRITARRGTVEERGSAQVFYREPRGALISEMQVSIKDGALKCAVCVPRSSVYVSSPTRYEMTVTDDDEGAALLLRLTSDMADPVYRLDDDALVRADAGDSLRFSTRTAGAKFHECRRATWCGRE